MHAVIAVIKTYNKLTTTKKHLGVFMQRQKKFAIKSPKPERVMPPPKPPTLWGCTWCGSEGTPSEHYTWARGGKRVFCSPDCSQQFWHEERQDSIRERVTNAWIAAHGLTPRACPKALEKLGKCRCRACAWYDKKIQETYEAMSS